MSGLQDLLNSSMGTELIKGLARETGQAEDKTAEVLSMAMPTLLGAMKKNASSPQGAESLMNALSSRHSGDILNDLGGLFNGGVDESVKNDGANILGHLFGSRQPAVEHALGQRAGMNPAAISQMIKIAAPILMGLMGRQRAQGQFSDSGGLNSILGGLLGGQSGMDMGALSSILDADGDGSFLDDVSDMMGGTANSSGGLGSLLGGLFGK
jgi:hypothetical protein